jgi:hypothetical protein
VHTFPTTVTRHHLEALSLLLPPHPLSSLSLFAVKKRAPTPQNLTYLEAAEYLRENLQFSNMTEMTRVLDLAMNPNSLFGTRQGKRGPTNPHARKLSVDDDVRPVVEWLFDQGLDKKGALRVLVDHPPVLCYSIKDRLQPFMELLKSTRVGLTREEAATLLQKRASILGMDPENLNRIVSFLVDQHGVSREEMLGMLEKSL